MMTFGFQIVAKLGNVLLLYRESSSLSGRVSMPVVIEVEFTYGTVDRSGVVEWR